MPENPFTKELKQAVVQVWHKSGFPNMPAEQIYIEFNGRSRYEQLGILALAFYEIGHIPILESEQWRRVPNPFAPGSYDPKRIEDVSNYFKSTYGLDIRIPDEQIDLNEWSDDTTARGH